MMDQPAADAGAAVGVFAGRLEGALQHVSAHTAQKTLIHIAHKPLQVIAHPANTQMGIKLRCCNSAGSFVSLIITLTIIFLPDKITFTSSTSSSFFLLLMSTPLVPPLVTFPLVSALLLWSFLLHPLLTCCSIKVGVSFPLKPSPTFGSASPWGGIPDNHRQAAVRRDHIRSERQTELQD